MGDVMIDRLIHERNAVESKIKTVETIAVDEKRDLRPEDIDSIRTYSERLKTIDSQLEVVTNRVQLDDSIAERIAAVSVDRPVGGHNYRSASEMLWDALRPGDPDARARYAPVLKRAAEHMGTDAASTVAVAGGFGGLSVSGPQGPVIDLQPKGRPWLTAIGVRQAPSSFSFTRPRIVDPDFTELPALSQNDCRSRSFRPRSLMSPQTRCDLLQSETTSTFLCRLSSLFPVRWTLLLTSSSRASHMQRKPRLLRRSLARLLLFLSHRTQTPPLCELQSLTQQLSSMSRRARFRNGLQWVRRAGLVSARSLVLAQRPLFPYVNPVNADGTSSAASFSIAGIGLQGIVTPGITDGSYYVGNELGVEAYEYRYPVLQAVEPSLLGRQIAVAASLVIYRPTTDGKRRRRRYRWERVTALSRLALLLRGRGANHMTETMWDESYPPSLFGPPPPVVVPITGVTAGAPGAFILTNATEIPATLIAGARKVPDNVIGDAGTNKPAAVAWNVGEYVVLGNASQAHWSIALRGCSDLLLLCS